MRADLVRSLLKGDERFAVTGASGWLGRTALELLSTVLGPERFRASVVGFASATRTVTLRDGTVVHLRPLEQLADVAPAPTHVLHFACLTRNRVAQLGVSAYVHANLAITATVVGAIARLRPRGVFTASSGAVYGPDRTFVTDLTANPYGTFKHLEELVVRCATADIGARSVVSRIFSLSGPYITRPEQYALGDFLLQALAGGPITVRAEGPVERCYCAAKDVVSIGICCLLGDSDDIVFDSGGEVIELGRLAERVRAALGLPDLGIVRPCGAGGSPDRYVGDVGAMSRLADAHGLAIQSLDEQILETAGYLAQIQAASTQRR